LPRIIDVVYILGGTIYVNKENTMKTKLSILGLLLLSLNLFAFETLLKTGTHGSIFVKLNSSQADYRIDYTKWVPEKEKDDNPVIVYNHGLQSHRGWENETFEKLRDKGFVVYAFDRIGSGTSDKELSADMTTRLKGHINKWESFVETLDQFLENVKQEYPKSPIHLWANSYGAKIVTAYLLQNKDERITSTVFTTPGLYRNVVSMPVTLEMMRDFKNADPERYFKSMITDKFSNGGVWFTDDEKYLKLIDDDKKSLRIMTKQFLVQTQLMDDFIKEKSADVKNSLNSQERLYVMVRGDEMMDNGKVLAHIAQNPDGAQSKFFNGGKKHKHFLAFTEDADKVFDYIVNFLSPKTN